MFCCATFLYSSLNKFDWWEAKRASRALAWSHPYPHPCSYSSLWKPEQKLENIPTQSPCTAELLFKGISTPKIQFSVVTIPLSLSLSNTRTVARTHKHAGFHLYISPSNPHWITNQYATYYSSRLLSQNGEGRYTITRAFCMGCICEHRFASFRGPGSPRIVPARRRQRQLEISSFSSSFFI